MARTDYVNTHVSCDGRRCIISIGLLTTSDNAPRQCPHTSQSPSAPPTYFRPPLSTRFRSRKSQRRRRVAHRSSPSTYKVLCVMLPQRRVSDVQRHSTVTRTYAHTCVRAAVLRGHNWKFVGQHSPASRLVTCVSSHTANFAAADSDH